MRIVLRTVLTILVRTELIALAVTLFVSSSVHLPCESVVLPDCVVWSAIFSLLHELVVGVSSKRAKIFSILHKKQRHRRINRGFLLIRGFFRLPSGLKLPAFVLLLLLEQIVGFVLNQLLELFYITVLHFYLEVIINTT